MTAFVRAWKHKMWILVIKCSWRPLLRGLNTFTLGFTFPIAWTKCLQTIMFINHKLKSNDFTVCVLSWLKSGIRLNWSVMPRGTKYNIINWFSYYWIKIQISRNPLLLSRCKRFHYSVKKKNNDILPFFLRIWLERKPLWQYLSRKDLTAPNLRINSY